jgi:hypothetical protein
MKFVIFYQSEWNYLIHVQRKIRTMEASRPTLKFVDLADMLQRPELSPEAKEQRERGFRRGYRDGWIGCLETFERALDAHAHTAGFDFWQTQLLEWLHAPSDRKVVPPELPY